MTSGSRSFAGKVVVVTGAASGIGRATALAFARENAALVLFDLDEPALATTGEAARAAGARSVSCERLDVSDAEAVAASAATLRARHGGVHVLVNSAGVALVGSFLDTEPADFRFVLDVNLWGVIHTTRAFLPLMLVAGGGQVVNVASASAFAAPAGLGAYATTKAAVLGLSEALRFELGPLGVGVSVVCPGFVDTPLVEKARLLGAFTGQRAAIRARTTGRGVAPERVASAIVAAARKNRGVVPVTFDAWGLYLLKRLTPWLVPRVIQHFSRAAEARAVRGRAG